MKANLIEAESSERILFSIAFPDFEMNSAVISMISRIAGGGTIIPSTPLLLFCIEWMNTFTQAILTLKLIGRASNPPVE